MEFIRRNPERKELEDRYDTVIVAPGFENNTHRSGLHWDTRIRLVASAMLYEKGQTDRIIVGGDRIREMKQPFSALMKQALVDRYAIPAEDIQTEEYTFDTASQIEWMQQHPDHIGKNSAMVTDTEQQHHIRALMDGFQLTGVDVVSAEDVIRRLAPGSNHFDSFFNKLHHSPYWLQWKGREALLTLLTKTIDPRGEKLQAITRNRLKHS